MSTLSKKLVFCLLLAFLLTAASTVPAAAQTKSDEQAIQSEIQRARIFRETYPLISETDLYCAIYVQESKLSDMRITTAERSDEKILLSDADFVFINKGTKDGVEVGQVFLVVELGDKVGGYGLLAAKRGRATVIFLEDSRAVARVEKSCGRVLVGDYLLPFEEKDSVLGKDQGYQAFSAGGAGPAGNIIYLERDYNQIGSGYYGIIDIGEANDIQVGQQMTIYRTIRKDLPKVGIGNVVVVETQAKTSTIKVLSCSDAVRIGMQVQGFLMGERAETHEVVPPKAEEQPKLEKAEETKPAPPSEEEIFKSKSLDQINNEQPLEMIHFDYDMNFIRDDAKPILEADAAWLKKFTTVRTRIEGYADERGTEEYNMVLGEKRAKSTLDYLISLGIPQERMEIISYGKTRPLDTGKNETAWAKNRRAQFLIIAK